MQFHPLLQDPTGRVFLIHCNVEVAAVHTALLVVDGFIDDEWLQVTDGMAHQPHLLGMSYLVQLPAEVVGQPERYKGYDCVLPLKKLA
jgi:hypothetical protein